MLQRLFLLCCLLALPACGHPPLSPPPGWPLPELMPTPDARALPLAQLAPPDRPYYSSSSDDSIRPAIDAQQRLLAEVKTNLAALGPAAYTYADRAVTSTDGSPGRGWGIAFSLSSGWNTTLAQCENVLKQPAYRIVQYVPGQLRVYYSHDRRTEVCLVAGKREQLLLAINRYDPPLPSERALAQREDAEHAARELAEQVKTAALDWPRRQ